MATCWILTGLITLALAFVSCAISFVAPYWVHEEGVLGDKGFLGTKLLASKDRGLWAHCSKDTCTWFFDDEFAWEKSQPTWMQASQALFGFGIVTILAAFLIACVNLCCGCCKEAYSVIKVISGLLIFAFLEVGASVALFGVKNYLDEDVDLDGSKHFMWGYWLGCGGALVTLLAGIFYSCGCCAASRYEGYSRENVV